MFCVCDERERGDERRRKKQNLGNRSGPKIKMPSSYWLSNALCLSMIFISRNAVLYNMKADFTKTLFKTLNRMS